MSALDNAEARYAYVTRMLRLMLENKLEGADGAAGLLVALEGGTTSIDVQLGNLLAAGIPPHPISTWPYDGLAPHQWAPVVLRQWQSGNFWDGRPYGPPIALAIHTEAGSEGGTQSEFTHNSSQVSSTYAVALSGLDDQFVALQDTAWANGIREPGNNWDSYQLPNVNPNYLTVSIETEDGGDNTREVTQAQYDTVGANCETAISRYPSIIYLLGHRDISPSSRINCPGERWIATGKLNQLARDLRLKTLAWH